MEARPGACKGKRIGGMTLTKGDIAMIRKTYNCTGHVSKKQQCCLLDLQYSTTAQGMYVKLNCKH
jgi:hypothetical protein